MRWRWERTSLRWCRRACACRWRYSARRGWHHSARRWHRHTRWWCHSRREWRRRTRREGRRRTTSQVDWCTTCSKRWEHARWRREWRRKCGWSSKHRWSCGPERRRVVASHECLVCCKLSCKFRVCRLPIVHLGSFGWRLANRARCETQLFFFSAFVGCHVRRGDPFHSEDFDLIAISTR